MLDGLELLEGINNLTEESNSLAPEASGSSDLDRLLEAILSISDVISTVKENTSPKNYNTVSSTPTVNDILSYEGNLNSIIPAGFIMLHNDLAGSLKSSLEGLSLGSSSDEEGGIGESLTSLKEFTSLFSSPGGLAGIGSLIGPITIGAVSAVAAAAIAQGIWYKIQDQNQTVASGRNAAGEQVEVAKKEVTNINWYSQDDLWDFISSNFTEKYLTLDQWQKFLDKKGIVDINPEELISQAYQTLLPQYLSDLKTEMQVEMGKALSSQNASVRDTATQKYNYEEAEAKFTSSLQDYINKGLSSSEIFENLLSSDQIDTHQGISNIAAEVLSQFGLVKSLPGGVNQLSNNAEEGYMDAVLQTLMNIFDISQNAEVSNSTQTIVDTNRSFREIDKVDSEISKSQISFAEEAVKETPQVDEGISPQIFQDENFTGGETLEIDQAVIAIEEGNVAANERHKDITSQLGEMQTALENFSQGIAALGIAVAGLTTKGRGKAILYDSKNSF